MKRLLLAMSLTLIGCSGPSPVADRSITVGAAALSKSTAIVQYDRIHHPVLTQNSMVVSQNRIATQVGQSILAQGGNATDAAIATAFALAVTLPRAGNIGGSGFLMHYDADSAKTTALDFRSAAPAAFDPNAYRQSDGLVDRSAFRFGPQSVGVPGTVAGLHHAWRASGSMDWQALIAPAIELAASGVRVSHDLAFALSAAQTLIRAYPSSAKVFLNADGKAPAMGTLLRQPALAASLRSIADGGADALYRGSLGRALAKSIQSDGGFLNVEDLNAYRARERTPLRGSYRGYQVLTMPPVSGGGITLLQMLAILERFDLSAIPQGGAAHLHLMAEVMKRGAASRRSGIGDPDFASLDLEQRLAPASITAWAQDIDPNRATPVSAISAAPPLSSTSRDTTHLSVVDAKGSAVSLTYTLGYSFGSGYVAGDTGILLDNQMQNFYYDEARHANGFAPGKRMMSTMTPTIVLDPAGNVALVTGTPGGSRIVNAVLQVIVNVIDYGMDIASATHAPRIHQNWSAPRSTADSDWTAPPLQVEPTLSRDTREALEALGHKVEETQTIGSTQSIAVGSGYLQGAADPRRPDAQAAGS